MKVGNVRKSSLMAVQIEPKMKVGNVRKVSHFDLKAFSWISEETPFETLCITLNNKMNNKVKNEVVLRLSFCEL